MRILSHEDEGIEASFPVGDDVHLLIHQRSCNLPTGKMGGVSVRREQEEGRNRTDDSQSTTG